jgi:DNA repair protein RecO (recombination protein O)
MAYWKSLALCLRVIDYGETSQIAVFFTRERGRVSVIAKGAKRKGSRFAGEIEPLALVELVCVKRRDGAGLHTLAELDVRDTYRGARQELERLYAATYVIELLREATPEDEPQPALFDLALAALDRIARTPVHDPLAVMTFEARALGALGLFPTLEVCADCGVPTDGARGQRFSPARGGVLCGACGAKDRAAREVSAGALQALQLLAHEPEKAARLKLATPQRQELRAILNAYVSAALEKPLRLAKYL